jgi:hypothetical protein
LTEALHHFAEIHLERLALWLLVLDLAAKPLVHRVRLVQAL